MLKAVIDTSVFISGVISKTGSPRRTIQAISNGLFIPVVCEETIEEFIDVSLRPKFKNIINATETKTLIATLNRHALIVRPAVIDKALSADPDDDIFLKIALTARANFIVSLDSHLLDLKSFRSIPIVRPSVFIQRLDFGKHFPD